MDTRVTAGFVLERSKESEYCYALFFLGDNEEKHLFGASLAVLFFNNTDSLFSSDFGKDCACYNECRTDDLYYQQSLFQKDD